MSLKYKFLDNNIEYCWYTSSSILYSECSDNENEFKTLLIVFNNGNCYIYNNIDVYDYIYFRDDLSQGKSLYKYIINKKEKNNGVRKEKRDINEINSKLNNILLNENKIENSEITE